MTALFRRTVEFAALAAVLALGLASGVQAQVCGDADGNGSVSVTDGVQALRAAAELSSICQLSVCDVDGNGSITVTDGVNILRKAAELPITEACGGINAQVQSLLQEVQPLLSIGIGFIPTSAGTARAAGQPSCQNPDGTLEFDQDTNTVSFTDCLLGGVIVDGDISATDNSVEFGFLTFTDPTTDDAISFDGIVTAAIVGANTVVGGDLDIDSDLFGTLTLSFQQLAVNDANVVVGGTLGLDLTESDLGESISVIDLTFNPQNQIAAVDVTLPDQTQANFLYDLNTGQLTPA